MASVFISHSSLDKAYTEQLYSWLVYNNFDDIFVDYASIRGGDKWGEMLRRAKASCRVVLCLVTNTWLKSDECMGEFLASWYQGKRIIPLFLYTDRMLDDKQARNLARVKGEDQGITISLVDDQLRLQGSSAEASILAGLRAAGALAKIGLDPLAFEIDQSARPSPYPGLESFGETDADAAVFFGRTPELVTALEDLREMRANGSKQPYAIIGASGSGKSSLLKAGVLPRLRREKGWIVLRSFRPGNDPLTSFADALARTFADYGKITSTGEIKEELYSVWKNDRRPSESSLRSPIERMFSALRELADRPSATILVSMDQAEELALSTSESADVLADCLTSLIVRSPHPNPNDQKVINDTILAITIRSDNRPIMQASRRFAKCPARCSDLRSVPPHRFGDAIEGPARRYGVEIEPSLIEAMIEEAPTIDSLPLLAFAMQRLWKEYAASGKLTRQNYSSLGSMEGLVNDAAERALCGLEPDSARVAEVNISLESERVAAFLCLLSHSLLKLVCRYAE
jgi:hypothetical protein